MTLVNSADDPDTLTTLDELAAFLDEHAFTGSRSGDAADWMRSALCDRACAR